MTDADKIKCARRALRTILVRIRENPDVRYLIGAGTQTFTELTAALAAVDDEPVDKVMDSFIRGSSQIPHMTVEELLAEVSDSQNVFPGGRNR